MIDFSSPQTQLVVVDILFLLVALGMLLWFRAWLAMQTRKLDRRFSALDGSLKQMAQIQERLQAVCRTLAAADGRRRETRSPASTEQGQEPGAAEAVPGSPVGQRYPVWSTAESVDERRASSRAVPARLQKADDGRAPQDGGGQRENYERARQLLGRGVSTDEVARTVGLGVAEVEVLKRMGELARSSSR